MNLTTTEQPQAHNKKEAKMETSLETQIEMLQNSARGYMEMAMLLLATGNETSAMAYLKGEVECFTKALELEKQLNDMNEMMAA